MYIFQEVKKIMRYHAIVACTEKLHVTCYIMICRAMHQIYEIERYGEIIKMQFRY